MNNYGEQEIAQIPKRVKAGIGAFEENGYCWWSANTLELDMNSTEKCMTGQICVPGGCLGDIPYLRGLRNIKVSLMLAFHYGLEAPGSLSSSIIDIYYSRLKNEWIRQIMSKRRHMTEEELEVA